MRRRLDELIADQNKNQMTMSVLLLHTLSIYIKFRSNINSAFCDDTRRYGVYNSIFLFPKSTEHMHARTHLQ